MSPMPFSLYDRFLSFAFGIETSWQWYVRFDVSGKSFPFRAHLKTRHGRPVALPYEEENALYLGPYDDETADKLYRVLDAGSRPLETGGALQQSLYRQVVDYLRTLPESVRNERLKELKEEPEVCRQASVPVAPLKTSSVVDDIAKQREVSLAAAAASAALPASVFETAMRPASDLPTFDKLAAHVNPPCEELQRLLETVSRVSMSFSHMAESKQYETFSKLFRGLGVSQDRFDAAAGLVLYRAMSDMHAYQPVSVAWDYAHCIRRSAELRGELSTACLADEAEKTKQKAIRCGWVTRKPKLPSEGSNA